MSLYSISLIFTECSKTICTAATEEDVRVQQGDMEEDDLLWQPPREEPKKEVLINTHKHAHTHIYMYVCVYVCMY